MSKSANKDYASATYYQYGNKEKSSSTRATNTDESFIRNLRTQNKEVIPKTYVNRSTSTVSMSSLLNEFAKSQLMSNKTLYKEQSILVDAFTSMSDNTGKFLIQWLTFVHKIRLIHVKLNYF